MEKGNQEWRRLVCCETARMSWPNRMVGGKKPLLKARLNNKEKARTKDYIEKFFVSYFGLELLPERSANEKDFDDWHWQRVEILADQLENKKLIFNTENKLTAISAKFINTFFHQLMKYEDFRYLWHFLHLPLDRRVFEKLSQKKCYFDNKASISYIISKSPYTINKSEYHAIQKSLWFLIDKINEEKKWGRTLTSRIELNLLWI